MIIKHAELTDRILTAFYAVYRALGYGFLEKVYGAALKLELEKAGLQVVVEQAVPVFYAGRLIGEYFADLVVANLVIIELKAVRVLAPEHEAQLLNYLKATTYEVGMLLNFGPSPQVKRKLYDNIRKRGLGWPTPQI